MYAIVRNVVVPARHSRRTVLPRSRTWKNRSMIAVIMSSSKRPQDSERNSRRQRNRSSYGGSRV
jgi:hypothetical protein